MVQGKSWAARLGRLAFNLVIFSLVVAPMGVTLARYDVIPKMPGFLALLIGAAIAAIALILALVSLFLGRGGRSGARGKALLGLAIALVYVGFIGSRPLLAEDVPPLHDITTDLANPPEFATLRLRADNLAGVGTPGNWRKMHAQAYPDLRSVTIARPVAAVTADAVRLAEEAGWEVVTSDTAAGRVEATASVSYIRFHDDVVIRIAPLADGTGSRVDMRSVSRVGIGDFGINARRIRTFLDALAAA